MTGKKVINYTNRDFDSIKNSLIEYAKQYYPTTYRDFSEASFGAIMIDLLSLIGDNLSFYLDYQANEQFLSTAVQYENIVRLARERGYRDTGKFSSQAQVDFYIQVPADSFGRPDSTYLPILEKNSSFAVQGPNAAQYLLAEDVDFSLDSVQKVVAAETSDGLPSSFVLKASGKVVSGNFYSQQVVVETYEKFFKVRIDNPLLTEIISVIDSSGNEYYQVDYLSQNCIYKPVKNAESPNNAEYKIIKQFVPRRFVVEQIDGFYNLVFGNGSVDSVLDPRNVVLNFSSRQYTSEPLIDPSSISQNDKFGLAPNDTTLTIIYRANNSLNMAASVGALSRVLSSKFKFSSTSASESVKSGIAASLEVSNPAPISAVEQALTADELKRRAFDSYSAQYRAVTREDYIDLCYKLDPKFGAVKRANIIQDQNSFKRNLNLFVLGEDANNNLCELNSVVKDNLKKWIQNFKMMNDTIDILNAKIINIGIEFTVDTNHPQKELVALKCINKLKKNLFQKFDIGENLDISRIYKIFNSIPEVIDTKKIKIILLNGAGYNSSNYDLYGNLSADKSYIYCPEDSVFEIKNWDTDIIPTVI